MDTNKIFIDVKIWELEFENATLKRKNEALNNLIEDLRRQIHILEEINILEEKHSEYFFDMEE